MKTETHFEREIGQGDGVAAARPLVIALVAVAAILVVYWQTAVSIVDIWHRSGTFAHGFFVVPLTFWLIWRDRASVPWEAVRPFWPALAGVAGAGALWLLGDLAGVAGVMHLALYVSIVSAVVAVLGVRVARAIAFPLAFLAFAVPFGEFLIPTLVDWTAEFTVAALRLSGIPVHQEGNHFVIPSGRWSVVDACSGIRYLIASFMVGILYAHLTYRTRTRRLAFIALSIAVPVVANWVRAYLIVMIGHLSDNALATGVDHIVYGWVFFGLVMALMFWIGSLWQEKEPVGSERLEQRQRKAPPVDSPDARAFGVAAAAVALATVWPVLAGQIHAGAERTTFELGQLDSSADWQVVPRSVQSFRPAYSNQDALLAQRFADGGRNVELFIAYFANQSQGREMIASGNTLISEYDTRWAAARRWSVQLQVGSTSVLADATDLRGPEGAMIVYSWYWLDGWLTANAFAAKAWLAAVKLLGRPDNSALVVVAAPYVDSREGAMTAIETFAAARGGEIDALLRRARKN